jgi:hypothetical protein
MLCQAQLDKIIFETASLFVKALLFQETYFEGPFVIQLLTNVAFLTGKPLRSPNAHQNIILSYQKKFSFKTI